MADDEDSTGGGYAFDHIPPFQNDNLPRAQVNCSFATVLSPRTASEK